MVGVIGNCTASAGNASLGYRGESEGARLQPCRTLRLETSASAAEVRSLRKRYGGKAQSAPEPQLCSERYC